MLKVAGDRLVTPKGQPVILRGVGLGGWMMMENFLNGFPGTEHQARDALRRSMGAARADLLFDRILDEFFTDADAAFIAGIGLNCVRIAVNYRHLSDDADPFAIREDGMRRLTDAVDACARTGLYTVIDLHAAPGFQNQSEHSDNPSHHAWLWRHRHFQDRVVAIWEALADRFRGRPEVAGYNLLNEPGDPTGEVIGPFYRRLVDAVRAVDPDHVIFLDGNRYANDFDVIGDSYDNTVYSTHDYALAGIREATKYPGEVRGQYVDRSHLEARFLERTAHCRKTGTPVWVGEFGPVYSGDPDVDRHRYAVLRDQLEIYREYGASWSIWTYKDTHLSGLVSLDPNSPWSRLLQPIREKKERLGTEPWSTGEEGISHVLAPLDDLLAAEYPDFDPPPFGRRWYVRRLVRELLLGEPMLTEFAALFATLDDAGIEALAGSFRLDTCIRRAPLLELLTEFTRS
ncbi:glycoside hydrolase family 5 protein [Streptomyces sp. PSKA54]|uniref:Glycoside hydrolase family 5 protein n=2 Tax=Streptomyces TaxID=1883 RepID=A0A7W2D387_9ACTN|nr:glycoside hydrolase family 5 protein [Streptomyces himalayensis subsp. aureolus]